VRWWRGPSSSGRRVDFSTLTAAQKRTPVCTLLDTIRYPQDRLAAMATHGSADGTKPSRELLVLPIYAALPPEQQMKVT
jgi:hypothetical protein